MVVSGSGCSSEDAGQTEMLPHKTIDDSRISTLIICNSDAGNMSYQQISLAAPQFRKDILLFVGSDDDRTPQWMSEKIYNALPADINKKLSVHDGAGHGGAEFPFFVDWRRWAEETVGFMMESSVILAKYMSQSIQK